MLILVPFKPVVIVFGFIAALMLFCYFGTALVEGKNLLAPYGDVANRVTFGRPAAHSAPAHKKNNKPKTVKSD
jgi:hypothetical protein